MGKQNEESGIAVILEGGSVDLFASLNAIELAKRTGKTVHAVVTGQNNETGFSDFVITSLHENGFSDPMMLAVKLGEAEGVLIRWHTLLDATEDELIGFLRTCRIFCLIAGAKSKKSIQRKTLWLEDLRSKLINDAHWYPNAFWVLVTEPWDNTMFERVVRKLSPRGSGTAEMV